jgi:signal transduction histidine kinase
MSNSNHERQAGKTWHGAARPNWAGRRLLQYLGYMESRRPDSDRISQRRAQAVVNHEGTDAQSAISPKRMRLNARAGAEMLQNSLLSLEARLGATLGAYDQEMLSTLIGVFSGLVRLIDGGTLEGSVRALEKELSTGERIAVDREKRQKAQTSTRYGAVSWNQAVQRTRVYSKEDREKSPITSTKESLSALKRKNTGPNVSAAETVDDELGPQSTTGPAAQLSRSQLMLYARDVARLYRAQRELHEQIMGMERNLEITEKAAAAGLLSGGVLHDVNHYLAVIRSAAELLQSELGTLSQANREDLGAIASSAARAGSLIHKFQFMARPGAETHMPVDLIETLLGARDLMKRQMNKKQIRLKMEINPELPAVLGDSAGLEEVIINLVGNALDILDPGGRIRIVADKVTRRDGGQDVALLVEDDGPGVPPELGDSIFEPFITGRRDGTGLGLYLVRRIVERHHGSVQLFSQPGKGARFLIRLPAMERNSDHVVEPVTPRRCSAP